MRRPADRMTNSADDRILEYLSDIRADSVIGKAPAEIGERIGYGRKYVGERCRELEDLGLLLNLGRGSYRITDLGEEYLSGELDARTLDAEDADDETDEE